MAFQNSNGDFDPNLVVNYENLSVGTLQTLKKGNVVKIATFLDLEDEVCESTKPKIIAAISVGLQLAEREDKRIADEAKRIADKEKAAEREARAKAHAAERQAQEEARAKAHGARKLMKQERKLMKQEESARC